VRRRDFITLLGGAAAAWPLAARAQQTGAMRRIGVLMAFAEGDREGQAFVTAFRDDLRHLGWIEGRNIRIDRRWATADDPGSIPRLADELVALEPDLILSHSTPTTAALLKRTRTIPIIFAFVSDPLGSGFVASFREPNGNATGFIVMEPTMAGKWLELLKEVAPHATRLRSCSIPLWRLPGITWSPLRRLLLLLVSSRSRPRFAIPSSLKPSLRRTHATRMAGSL
jgi:putative ABC transport system substrate-binding protein